MRTGYVAEGGSRYHGRPPPFPEPITATQLQADFLNSLAAREIPIAEMNSDELAEKEVLRLLLETICQKTVAIDGVELKCFGSLSTTFATKGSDMDLVLLSPRSKPELSSSESNVPRLIERALLDLGYGAKLLTKTRIPIIKFYEKPTPEVLASLLADRQKYEDEKDKTPTFGKHEIGKLPLAPKDGQRTPRLPQGDNFDHPKGDMGIQCDINFCNHLGLHNSQLLKCYSLCDPRVRCMVLFVKAWAKKRKINSSYHGTLSSYGYVLMVLHYLVNIARPPIVPNLQLWKLMSNQHTDEMFASEIEVDGHAIRFYRNEVALEELQRRDKITFNHMSLGSLLREFFHYYAQQGDSAPRGGFRWTLDVLSLRTQNGLLTKQSKGWTAATTKVTETAHVRQRYLLAIEDPFETDHNVARTVVHAGIVAIRDEFRRAHRLISSGSETLAGPDYLFAEARDRENLQRRRKTTGESDKIKNPPKTLRPDMKLTQKCENE